MRNTCMTTIHKFKHFFMPNMLHFVNLYGTIEYRLPIPIWSELLQVLLRSCWFTIAKMSVTLDICGQRVPTSYKCMQGGYGDK